jgi:flavin-binding protein dodecin
MAPGRSNTSTEEATRDGVSDAQTRIDEYLSFHARVTEDNGKFTLMPWSGLRTHAN